MIFGPAILRPGIFRHAFGVGRIASAGNSVDPATRDYLAKIQAAGVTVTSIQQSAINAFIVAEKAAGRWDSHKRIYLPIWGSAAANAVCMKSLASGTFVGGVTHGAGFVQGNGTNGYFNTSVTPSTLGQTLSSASITALITQAPSGTAAATAIGSIDGGDTSKLIEFSHLSSTAIIFRAMTAAGIGAVQIALARASQIGIFVSSREGGDRRIIQRLTSGVTTLVNTAAANAGSVPTTGAYQMMRSGFSGGAAYSDGRYGFFAASLGQTVAEAQAFTANVKTLWEISTGLTLP